jgi:TRAP-type C4-dicarboxylate transport system permease small subunit
MSEGWQSNVPVWVVRVSGILRDVAGVVLVGMMLMTVYDIVSRYFGFGSIEAVVELTTLGVVIVASFGLAIVTVQAGHIFIDLFTRNNKPRTNERFDSIWYIIMGIFLIVIAYLSVQEGLILHADNTTTEVLEWSLLSFYLPPVIGWLFAGITALWIGIVVLWRGNRSEGPVGPQDTQDF